MIQFNCPGCGKRFDVPEQYIGKRAKCKTCGESVVVPAVSTLAVAPAPAPAATVPQAPPAPSIAPVANTSTSPKLPVRTRRLLAEAEQIREAFANSARVKVVAVEGNPAEYYRIEYNVRGLELAVGSKEPRIREQHTIEIHLPSDYPRLAPQCKIITPIFHPNFDKTTICVGDHWTAGERLVDLVTRIGEMIAYQAYNIKSPLDGEAAMWADLHHGKFPIDTRAIASTST